jgi:hypothetical protein
MITTTINFLEQFAYLLLRSWHPILRFSLRNTILCLKFDVSERQKFPYRLVWSFCCAVPLPLDVSETVFSHTVLRFSRLAFFNVICAVFCMGEPGYPRYSWFDLLLHLQLCWFESPCELLVFIAWLEGNSCAITFVHTLRYCTSIWVNLQFLYGSHFCGTTTITKQL